MFLCTHSTWPVLWWRLSRINNSLSVRSLHSAPCNRPFTKGNNMNSITFSFLSLLAWFVESLMPEPVHTNFMSYALVISFVWLLCFHLSAAFGNGKPQYWLARKPCCSVSVPLSPSVSLSLLVPLWSLSLSVSVSLLVPSLSPLSSASLSLVRWFASCWSGWERWLPPANYNFSKNLIGWFGCMPCDKSGVGWFEFMSCGKSVVGWFEFMLCGKSVVGLIRVYVMW